MSTTPPPSLPPPPLPPVRRPPADPSRTGTLWIGACGAALLLASAAVLTAMRWDDLAQTTKLAGLVAITAAMLFGGQRLRAHLAVTGRAIFHLGALLIPFDVAAVTILAGRGWEQSLLISSLAALPAWAWVCRFEPSPVMRVATATSVVATAAGIAAVSPVSMPLALALIATPAAVYPKVRQDRHDATQAVTAWILVAGLSGLAALQSWPPRVAGLVHDLGFAAPDRPQLVIAAVLATVLSAAMAHQRPTIERAWMTVALAVTATAIASVAFATATTWIAIGALVFALFEALALVAKRDSLWTRVVAEVEQPVEIIAALLTLILLGDLATLAGSNAAGFAGGVLALGWITADWRRCHHPQDWLVTLVYGSGWGPTTVLAPLSILGGLGAVGASDASSTIAALVISAWAGLTRRSFGRTVAAVFALGAIVASPLGWFGIASYALSATIMAACARIDLGKYQSQHPAEHQSQDPSDRQGNSAGLLSGVAAFVGLTMVVPLGSFGLDDSIPILVALGLWVLRSIMGPRIAHPVGEWASLGTTFSLGLSLLTIFVIEPLPALGLCTLIVAGAGCEISWRHPHQQTHPAPALSPTALPPTALPEPPLGPTQPPPPLAHQQPQPGPEPSAVQTRRPLVLPVRRQLETLAAVAASFAPIPIGQLVDASWSQTGAATAALGTVLVAMSIALRSKVTPLVAVMTLTLSTLGLGMAIVAGSLVGPTLLFVGASLVLFGATALSPMAVGTGLVAVSIGSSIQLSEWQLDWAEAHLAVPAAIALWAGSRFHRSGTSSWVSYAPTIGIVGAAAVLERLAAGSGWHSVIAGAIGVGAVATGGTRRLKGPLVVGTALLGTIVVYEGLGPSARVPTWLWLAAGGIVLLGAAMAMERQATTPLEQGQRLRAVLANRFT